MMKIVFTFKDGSRVTAGVNAESFDEFAARVFENPEKYIVKDGFAFKYNFIDALELLEEDEGVEDIKI